MFDGVVNHLHEQKTEISQLRSQLQQANQETIEANRKASSQLAQSMEEENATAEAERDQLLSQIKILMDESRQRQFGRMKSKFDGVRVDISSSGDALEQATTQHDRHVDEWVFKSEQFAKDVTASRDEVKTKMQNDWEVRDISTRLSVYAHAKLIANRYSTIATHLSRRLQSPYRRRLSALSTPR